MCSLLFAVCNGYLPYFSFENVPSNSRIIIFEVRQYRKSSEKDDRVDTIWNELQGICLHGNQRGTVQELKRDTQVLLKKIRGEKEILRIVSLLKNGFKGTCTKPVRDCTELKKYNKLSGVYKITAGNSKALKVYCVMTTDGGGWSIIQRHQDGNVDFQRTWAEYENGFGNLEGDYWLGDSMKFHNGMLFSSTDQDNDQHGSDCAKQYGPWWHKQCCTSALNNKLSSNLYWTTFDNNAAKSSVMMIRRI
ncbi:unnamed protein product [Mytilus edulis]|uniref:Fibrinogen C-terminal domain-containing protein n=1 Tax=Mytilus edulis TaxID=6550 RepID=A0A8S3V344_MYTED|nr:unnamed protein product [Mytilus edulis]